MFPFRLIPKVWVELALTADETGPSGYVEEPKASCPFAVAVAPAPKISEPEKSPDWALYPKPEL